MAKAKTRPQTRKPSGATGTGIVTDPNDAQSWLFLNPTGPNDSGTTFGVLRRTYGDRVNTAASFGAKKACPVEQTFDAGVSWPVTAARIDVVLPPGADDALSSPRVLLDAMDAHALPTEPALLVYVTVPFPDVTRLHQAWECARGFAAKLARQRNLAILTVLHAPGTVSSPNPVHAHLCISARSVPALGMSQGLYDRDLICDRGQSLIERLWQEHLAEWSW